MLAAAASLARLSRAGQALRRRPLGRCMSTEYASSCFLPTEWLGVPLVGRRAVSHDTDVYTFGLPDGRSLDLPVCACLLVRAPGSGAPADDAVRPYTPISPNEMLGRFELLVKRYAGGAVSQHLASLDAGALVDMKHIAFNIKAQYPFTGVRTVTMLCAGTGITPMYQALWKLLGTPGDQTRVTLIYGSKSADDILLRDELDGWAAAHPGRLTVVHCVGESADAPPAEGWADTPTFVAEAGWVDEAKVARHAFPPADDTLVFVCGLPAMYDALCGPRGEAGLAEGSVLQRLGYTAEMVSKM